MQKHRTMYWYHDEVKQLASKSIPAKGDLKRVVFYGSSTFTLWKNLQSDFPEFETINCAFGGSTISACNWFFEQLIPALKPDILIIYAGDNDLGDGRHPEEVCINFRYMMQLIQKHFGTIPVAYVSIKHSFARQYLHNSIAYTNKIIREDIEQQFPKATFIDINKHMSDHELMNLEYFEPDGLHISKKGYQVWRKVIFDQFLSTKRL